MTIKIKQVTSWKDALNAARRTIGKEPIDKEPSNEWKAKIILAEHSPIRLVEYDIDLLGIPTFCANHLVRHSIGIEKFVCSNREDRSDKSPEEVNRLTPVDMSIRCNVQALINISRKRLCNCASKETREIWKEVVRKMKEIDIVVADKMVPECQYRGFCPEWMSKCKYVNTDMYLGERVFYLKTGY